MAAPVPESVSVTVFGTTNPVVVTKPTGLSLGDIMLAHIVCVGNATNQDVTIPSGWTSLGNGLVTESGIESLKSFAMWKVADSADVAASDFSFSIVNVAVVASAAAILRISGGDQSAPINASFVDSQNDTGADMTFAGIDPDVGETLLVMLAAANGTGGNRTTSGYSIVTSNPTWTERYDEFKSGAAMTMACATAPRTEDTATGNVTFNIDSGGVGTNSIGWIIAVPPESFIPKVIIF